MRRISTTRRFLLSDAATRRRRQFTQEVRIGSAANAPWRASADVPIRWQAGVFLFTQNYEQDAINNFSPSVLSPFVTFPVAQHSPQATLDDADRRLRPGDRDLRRPA